MRECEGEKGKRESRCGGFGVWVPENDAGGNSGAGRRRISSFKKRLVELGCGFAKRLD
jgi:hypothetical protein